MSYKYGNSLISGTCKYSHLPKRSGFTLIEIMIALALLGVMSAGVVQMLQTAKKGEVSAMRGDDFQELQKILMMFGQTTTNCATIFTGSTLIDNATTVATAATSINLPSITIPNGAANQTIALNGKYGSGMVLKTLTIDRTGAASGGSTYLATLTLTADRYDTTKVGANVGGITTMRGTIPVSLVDKDGNGKIDACLLGATSNYPRNEIIVAQSAPADYVGNTCSNIQLALTAASASSPARSVLVKAGTYINCSGIHVPINVTLRGEAGTVLQGDTKGDVLILDYNTANVNTKVSNLTIDLKLNTLATSCGIYIQRSNVHVNDITFLNQGATRHPAICAIGTASGSMSNIHLESNSFGSDAAINYAGEGVYIYNSSVNEVANVNIENNKIHVLFGNFVDVMQMSAGRIRELNINKNEGTPQGMGVKVYANNDNALIYQARITNNSFMFPATTAGTAGVSFAAVNDPEGVGIIISGNAIINARNGIVFGSEFHVHKSSGNLWTTGLTIKDNNIDSMSVIGAGNTGIHVQGSRGAEISNNVIFNFLTGITVANNVSTALADSANINGNSITNGGIAGMVLTRGIYFDQDNTTITANKIVALSPVMTRTGSLPSNTVISHNQLDAVATGPQADTCGGASGAFAICANGSFLSISDNRLQGIGAAMNKYGIALASGTPNTTYVMSNMFRGGPTFTNDCLNCTTYSVVSQDRLKQYFSTTGDVEFTNTGGIAMTGSGDLTLTSANSDVRLSGGGDVVVTGGGKIAVDAAGGINVGSGAPVAGKITVNGLAVPFNCTSMVTTCTVPVGGPHTVVECRATCDGTRSPVGGGGSCPVGAYVSQTAPEWGGYGSRSFITGCTCATGMPCMNSGMLFTSRAICCDGNI